MCFSNSHSTESTLQTTTKDTVSKPTTSVSKDVKKTPQSIRNSRRNLFRSSEKPKDVFNDSLEGIWLKKQVYDSNSITNLENKFSLHQSKRSKKLQF